MKEFLSGALMLTWFANSTLFYFLWKQVSERIFLTFSIAFALLCIERIVEYPLSSHAISTLPIYLLRLLAFTSIIWGVIDKNVSKSEKNGSPHQ